MQTGQSIRKTFLKSMMLVVVFSTGLLFSLWIYTEYRAFFGEAEVSRRDFEASQKRMLQQEVAGVVNFIRYRIEQSEDALKKNVKDRVYEAHAVAHQLYRENHALVPPEHMQKIIKDALRNLRFNEGRGYYFILDLDGVEVLSPVRPELEGSNRLSVQGAQGELIVKDMADIVRRQKEGFYTYTWTKPGQGGNGFLKTAFVTHFEPYDWIIGTGEYVEDAQRDVQDEVLARLVRLRFGREGYFFGTIQGGAPLFTEGRITRGEKNIWDLTDPDGVKIIQEYEKVVGHPEGGFVRYAWKKPGFETPSPKISFVTRIPEWDWILGAGVYLDTVEEEIQEKRALLLKKFMERSFFSFGLLFFLLAGAFLWARRISGLIQQNLDTLTTLFRKAASESLPMRMESLAFQEFRDMAQTTNALLEEQRRVEEALQESEEKYHLIFDYSPMGLLYFDAKGVIVACNRSFVQLIGSSEAALVGLDMLTLRDPDVVLAVQKALGGELGAYEGLYRSVTAQKETPLRGFFAPALKNGKVQGGVGIFEDISGRWYAEKEKARLEAQLQQVRKMESVGRLAGGVAHDFNNMLGIVLGHTELALEKSDAASPVHLHLREIRKAAMRSADLTRQLLAFARKQAIAPEPMDLNQAVEGMVTMLRPLIGEDIALRFHPGADLWPVLMDPSQMDQILANLCTNARFAIEGVGSLVIETHNTTLDAAYCRNHAGFVPGDFAVLTVSDTGCGMDRETLTHVFEPFFTTREVGQGTGLGLATVYGIVKQNNGFINAYSEPGLGTTFRVYLPRHRLKEENRVARRPVTEAPQGGDAQILLVEDEPAILEVTKIMLEGLGYTVLAASCADAALGLAEIHGDNLNLLITDVVMPGMNGWELAQKIRVLCPGIRSLFMSGYTANVIARHGVLDPGVAFIQKPFLLKDLAARVRSTLESRS
ncbi:cache domain-containing protein [Desulfobotulus sp.]|jgi:PAS domain S-box-containing protein|uniref:cache domain-containing protein n=1 Tax=Desulfobotulus sp. TaxID=1940337 RepID=UPI002A36F2B2|nr:cache domain-containing protein [Desulfobotulus sp.]MDY0164480.1 cache domain-containing protein [Desulfobotulus sp.]